MMAAQPTQPTQAASNVLDSLSPEHREAVKAVRENGYVLIPDALTAKECEYYIGLMAGVAKKSKTYIGGYLRASDIMESDIGFSKLLDHPSMYPIAKALLGGFARIMSTEAIIRHDIDDVPVRWHDDGP
jgi:hypothetical protein